MMMQTREGTSKPPLKSGLTICVDEHVDEKKDDTTFGLLCLSQLIYLKAMEIVGYLASQKYALEISIMPVTADTIEKYKTNATIAKRIDTYIIQIIFWKYLVTIFSKMVDVCPSSDTLQVVTSFMGWMRRHDMCRWNDYIYTDFVKMYRRCYAPERPDHFNAWLISRLDKWFKGVTIDDDDEVALPARTAADDTLVKGVPRVFTFTE